MTNILSLPNELTFDILIDLNYKDTITACSVNKKAKQICNSPSFWIQKAKYNLNVPPKVFTNNSRDPNIHPQERYFELIEEYLPKVIKQIDPEIRVDVDYNENIHDYAITILSGYIPIEVAVQISELADVNYLQFGVNKYTSNLAPSLWKILENINYMWYFGPWPRFDDYITKYIRLGKIFPNIIQLRVNNLQYALDPDSYVQMFTLFPNLKVLEYFVSSEDNINEDFDIATLTKDDIERLTPNSVKANGYSH